MSKFNSTRFTLGILLPAPMSLISFYILAFIQSQYEGHALNLTNITSNSSDAFTLVGFSHKFLAVALFYIFFAYIFIGIQSFFYSCLMESIAVKHAISRSKAVYYLYGFFFGALAGLSLLIFEHHVKLAGLIGMSLFGGLTGFFVSIVMGLTFSTHNKSLKDAP